MSNSNKVYEKSLIQLKKPDPKDKRTWLEIAIKKE
jgi:hypothetical protein